MHECMHLSFSFLSVVPCHQQCHSMLRPRLCLWAERGDPMGHELLEARRTMIQNLCYVHVSCCVGSLTINNNNVVSVGRLENPQTKILNPELELLSCLPPPSRSRLAERLKTHEQPKTARSENCACVLGPSADRREA